MTIQQYKKAHELQEQISKLQYEVNVIKEYKSADKKSPIRFGDNFNVSIPFKVEEDLTFMRFCSSVIQEKESIITLLQEEFQKI